MIELRRLMAASALFLVYGCSIFTGSDQVLTGPGYVTAGEPQAAEAGAAILAHGGNAADAVTATYLALSVTYPMAAGLGGGGLCVVHDGQTDSTLDFESRNPSKGGIYAVPANLGGFARLQAIYGRLPWQRVVSPAESLAGAGFRISRALESRLVASADIVRLDAALSAEFLNESGNTKPAGSLVAAPALAQTLSQIRTQGPEVLYRGPPAQRIAAYSDSQGGFLSAEDFESYIPTRSASPMMRIENADVYLPAASTPSGRYAAAVLAHLVGAQGEVGAHGSKLAHLVFSAAAAGYVAKGAASLPADLGETGFAAVDEDGMAVACGVTMNGPFGSGRTEPSTGITLANAPGIDHFALSGRFLTPVIALSDGQISLAGTGSGGPEGSAAILLALLEVANGGDTIRPGILQATGREPLETANAIACRGGICVAAADPRSFGFGAGGD